MPEAGSTAARFGDGPGLRRVGDTGLLLELPGLAEVLSVQAQLQERPAEGQVDVVAAARTVLVTVRTPAHVPPLVARLRAIDTSRPVERDDALVVIEVVYDGEDLADVARYTGLSADAVVDAHTGTPWTAAFGGFAPGFVYLTGGDPRLEVPRRDSPRTVVPAGSVALAGAFSSVYPRRSPGGWQLLGHTSAVLWDDHRADPALLHPGNRVRFEAVREVIEVSPPDASAGVAEGDAGLVVTTSGLLSTVQDLGRPGRMALGVAGSGALDRASLRQANRLVGNPVGAAGIESLNGGLGLRAVQDQALAVTGASVELVVSTPDGVERDVPLHAPFLLRAGEILKQSAPAEGLRSYTAVRGGVLVEQTLGSSSTDSMSGLGPPPLTPGSTLAVGAPGPGAVGEAELPRTPRSPELLRVVPGPREDWFDDGELARLCAVEWTVTAQSDRIGLRLDGPALRRSGDGELPSEGTVPGALQVPPSGLPVLFLADHPVTGGYPVIAVVVAADLDRAAQLPPGSVVRFTG